MPTAFKPRPMSEIVAIPAVPVVAEEPTAANPAVSAVEPTEVPAKYKDKSVDQVIEMHQNAEQRLGQIQNEVGNLRGLVTDLTAVQRPAAASQADEQEPVNVSGEDLLADPVSAIRKIITPELEAAEAKRNADVAEARVQTESLALETDFGDYATTVGSAEFQTFATRTPSRHADFTTAAEGSGVEQVRAARRLLEDFTDFEAQTAPTQQEAQTPVERARSISTERGDGGSPISLKPQLLESDVIALIQSDPAKYRSPSYQTELMTAIKEKRFVANS